MDFHIKKVIPKNIALQASLINDLYTLHIIGFFKEYFCIIEISMIQKIIATSIYKNGYYPAYYLVYILISLTI